MTGTLTEVLAEVAACQARIDAVVAERDALYEERGDLFLRLAEEDGVTWQELADAAGIHAQAVGQGISRARQRRAAAKDRILEGG